MNEPPGSRAGVGLTGLTVAEHFRDAEGHDVLLFIDNIFRFTQVWTTYPGTRSWKKQRRTTRFIQDYMFDESVCLLLRAKWFKPLVVEERPVVEEDIYEIEDYYYQYEEADDDLDDNEAYYGASANVRLGNRRWGDNSFVRAGRQEARPVHQPSFQDSGEGKKGGVTEHKWRNDGGRFQWYGGRKT
ncbi:uncharacterized protein LOC131608956 [Vicia villosa]|uniref:uncharacterized protein LOC131608956 n=1 Tax=Vicia villosa TaxID=3911 RepID=UPI00273CD8B1|nr:uncharacterized protein LOC131608956 [Vicia villosa]XP_058736541.1 uncharacterized protein LOC131608956 [Vicia villosa]XP_058736542.1 uncharacterized protein LOC131608956 [Vicia villosa]XP_058736543.1 uncharacterized protein LOC131608956 [Vicia villosa]XP_058736544.1 uncharacterized protein LOC131608956 [Vicia villosa]XP_058736546.1 uncharacterized protein LOC131608956 [Vicia villosa]